MAQLQALLGEDGVRWAIWIGLGFAALLGLLFLVFIIRRVFAPAFNMSSSSDRRGRPPRLGVTDFFNLDRAGRRLVIVRRDNVEHLVLVGGPNDILIESNIVRGVRPEAPIVDSSGRPIVQSRAADLPPADLPPAEMLQARDVPAPQRRMEAPPIEARTSEPRAPEPRAPEPRIPEPRMPEMPAPARQPARDIIVPDDQFAAEIGALAVAASSNPQSAARSARIAPPPMQAPAPIPAITPQSPEPVRAEAPPPPSRTPPPPELFSPSPANSRIQAGATSSGAPDLTARRAPQLNPQPLPSAQAPTQDGPLPEAPALDGAAPAPRRPTSFDDVSKRLQEALRRPQPLASSAVTTSSARNSAIPATLKPATFGAAKPAPADAPGEAEMQAPEPGEAEAAPPSGTQEEARPKRSSTDSPMAQIEELDLEQEMARLLGRAPGAKP